MSLLGLFGAKESKHKVEKKELAWNALTSLAQLDLISEESKQRPVVIFKHSTRCGTSRMILNEFERKFNLNDTQVKLYFLDLLSFREISNEIAINFQVIHQSPQMVVIKNGVTVHHASHGSIDVNKLAEFIKD